MHSAKLQKVSTASIGISGLCSTNSPDPLSKCSGVLCLVVGPSGVGKDSLIDGARAAFGGRPQFVFPTRIITRAANAGGEDYRAITEDDFVREEAAGTFALSWWAHELAYAIPGSISSDLSVGRVVTVNASRAILNQARRQFKKVRVISVRAPEEVLAQRLAKRGRESNADIQKRLDRAMAYEVEGPDVIEILNDGTLERAVKRFVDLLSEAAYSPN